MRLKEMDRIDEILNGISKREKDVLFLTKDDIPSLRPTKEEIAEVVKEELPAIVKPLIPDPVVKNGKDGKDAVVTEQMIQEIATLAMMDIEIPVVEKVIERTEVIKEIPVVRETIKETIRDSKELINEVKEIKERIDEFNYVDKKTYDDEIATLQNRTQLLLQIATQRTNTSSSSTPATPNLTVETPSGDVDGSNVTFTFTATPKVIVVDQGRFMKEGSGWSLAGLVATLDIAPNFEIYALL